jgi:hypothetical protein
MKLGGKTGARVKAALAFENVAEIFGKEGRGFVLHSEK